MREGGGGQSQPLPCTGLLHWRSPMESQWVTAAFIYSRLPAPKSLASRTRLSAESTQQKGKTCPPTRRSTQAPAAAAAAVCRSLVEEAQVQLASASPPSWFSPRFLSFTVRWTLRLFFSFWCFSWLTFFFFVCFVYPLEFLLKRIISSCYCNYLMSILYFALLRHSFLEFSQIYVNVYWIRNELQLANTSIYNAWGWMFPERPDETTFWKCIVTSCVFNVIV